MDGREEMMSLRTIGGRANVHASGPFADVHSFGSCAAVCEAPRHELAGKRLGELVSDAPAPPTARGSTKTKSFLSPRMRQLVVLLMDGRSEKQAANALGISPHTVHIHVTRLYRRLGVHSRAELLAMVYRARTQALRRVEVMPSSK